MFNLVFIKNRERRLPLQMVSNSLNDEWRVSRSWESIITINRYTHLIRHRHYTFTIGTKSSIITNINRIGIWIIIIIIILIIIIIIIIRNEDKSGR